MRALSVLILAGFASLMVYAVLSLPLYMQPDAPAHREQSLRGIDNPAAYYIRNAERDAHTPNIVTVILADYRSFDTLGEVVVVFTAGVICVLLLRERRHD